MNDMREIKIEKLVLHVGGIDDKLEKNTKLIEILTGRKAAKMKTRKRIPALNVRPKLNVGSVITIRRDFEPLLKRLLVAVDNKIRRKQVSDNTFSFGIKEYIEIPGLEYQRDIGITGFDVTLTFKRAGKRIQLRRLKKKSLPKIQKISPHEIIKYMEENFQTRFI
ncbi:MAG TPA: 50S ribosomal protein L5 [Candidatus Omnitrophota bacterium]|nr:50S ribosomal protein L5 [Candidatus Omnitrophota bacterium]